MYTTPHSKIYFLQTRAGKLLALGLMLSSGVANGLIMDIVYEKTRVTVVAILVFFLAFAPLSYALNRLRWVKNNNFAILVGFYLLLIVFDRISRDGSADILYFLGFSLLFHLGRLIFLVRNTERIAHIILDQRLLYIRAHTAYNNRDFESAIANLTNIIRSDNKRPDIFYIRGMSYVHTEQYSQAVEDCNRVIALSPAFANVYFWRGVSYKALNDERAAADLERALADCDDEELKDHARHHLQTLQSASADATGAATSDR